MIRRGMVRRVQYKQWCTLNRGMPSERMHAMPSERMHAMHTVLRLDAAAPLAATSCACIQWRGAYIAHTRSTRKVPARDVLAEGLCRVEHLCANHRLQRMHTVCMAAMHAQVTIKCGYPLSPSGLAVRTVWLIKSNSNMRPRAKGAVRAPGPDGTLRRGVPASATIPRPMPKSPMPKSPIPTVPAPHKPCNEPKLRVPRCSTTRIKRLDARDAAQALTEPTCMQLA
jgi:hypothetical protein